MDINGSNNMITDGMDSDKMKLVNPKNSKGIQEEHSKLKLIKLKPEQHAVIKNGLNKPAKRILISKFNMNIKQKDLFTVYDYNWLNDNIINFYMNLIVERGEKRIDLPTVYAMNTSFLSRLLQYGYNTVKRWTRKVDIFTKDMILIPVYAQQNHWCMAIIHLRNKTIKYYNSLGNPNPNVLNALAEYLSAESLDKHNGTVDTSNFTTESVENIPLQNNDYDCGVFTCMFAEFLTRNQEIKFSQKHIQYFRKKMMLEILQGKLLQ